MKTDVLQGRIATSYDLGLGDQSGVKFSMRSETIALAGQRALAVSLAPLSSANHTS
jgi:hypothetical protein